MKMITILKKIMIEDRIWIKKIMYTSNIKNQKLGLKENKYYKITIKEIMKVIKIKKDLMKMHFMIILIIIEMRLINKVK